MAAELSNTEVVAHSHLYLDRIGRPDLKEVLSPSAPIAYASPEYGLDQLGEAKGRLGYAGGLGILSGDHVRELASTGLPADAIGILHTQWLQPRINADKWQEDWCMPINKPEELGMEKEDLNVLITANKQNIPLSVYKLHVGGQTDLHLLSEPGIGEVYPGSQNSDHRLYQMSVLGFGGWQVMRELKKEPPLLHLNESSTSFMALSMWDTTMQRMLDTGMGVPEAFSASLAEVRSRTILTNHTLVPAAEAVYSSEQYEKYIMDNIQSPEIKEQLRALIQYNGGNMRVLDLGIFLAGKFNGVSQLHAKLATAEFQKKWGEHLPGSREMEFADVTNAIEARWYPRTYQIYRDNGVLDEFNMTPPGYESRIAGLDQDLLRGTKNAQKIELIQYLRNRPLVGENDSPINLPDDAEIVGWARRFAGYKRPGMMTDNITALKEVLAKHPKAHILYSGKTHPTDEPMKLELQKLLKRIENDETLRERVHFIQDYNIEVGRLMTQGADIWVNNPFVGAEACGTSIFKAIAGNALLVSTPDGGAADVPSEAYLAITGDDQDKELKSLLAQIDAGLDLVEGDTSLWAAKIKQQLTAYMPIIGGGRMIADYLNLGLPQKKKEEAVV